jgi:hypothetical protein
MVGQILDKLDSWVGKSFLLASFFPFLIFVAANIAMVHLLVPEAAKYLSSAFSGSIYGSISATGVGLAGLAALAYLLDPLVGVVTRLLEGAYFPRCVAGWLASDYAGYLRDLRQREQDAAKRATDIIGREKALGDEFRAKQAVGDAIGAIRDRGLIAQAAAALRPLQSMQERQQGIGLGQLESAADALKKALEANCIDKKRLAQGENAEDSEKLNFLNKSMGDIIVYARQNALDERDRTIDERLRSYSSNETPSTKFGNLAAALRGFCDETFNLDFEFLWPVVQIVSQGDQGITNSLANAKQKLDFCIRILMFSAVFTAIWLVVATFVAQSIYVVPVIGACGFVAAMIWLEFVHENYKSFAELVRTVIILKRFEVLKMMHYKMPSNWTEERDGWETISAQLKWRSYPVEISYQHPDK